MCWIPVLIDDSRWPLRGGHLLLTEKNRNMNEIRFDGTFREESAQMIYNGNHADVDITLLSVFKRRDIHIGFKYLFKVSH